jgi:hypothetical protein
MTHFSVGIYSEANIAHQLQIKREFQGRVMHGSTFSCALWTSELLSLLLVCEQIE